MLRSLILIGLFIELTILPRPAEGTDTSVPFINADQVHAQGITGRGVTVAVIDGGIDYTDPGLNHGIAPGGTSFEGGGEVPDGGQNVYGATHGTYMSVIITDTTGVAPNAMILPVRVIEPYASWGEIVDNIVLAVDYVILLKNADPTIRVINLSLGGFDYYTCLCDLLAPDNRRLADAISEAAAAGIITFAATGNEAVCGGIIAPACVSDAVPVAADYDGNYPPTSFGPPADCGDLSPDPYWIVCFSNIVENCNYLIAAPGYDINVGGFSGDGTSQATAHCSGVAALMFEKNACGTLDAYTARSIIYNTAWEYTWAYPYCPLPPEPKHVNALAAVNAVGGGGGGASGDLDCDGTVSAYDFNRFADCMTGPDAGPVVGFCVAADFPEPPPDGDVDLRDFAQFQQVFTGYGQGACCHADGTCTEELVSDCIAEFGARYQGHGTTCATVQCPLPSWGACCDVATQVCAEDSEDNCVWGGGFYMGDGTDCLSASCPTARYQNTIDPLIAYSSSGAGLQLADDITLAGAGPYALAYYDLGVYGGLTYQGHGTCTEEVEIGYAMVG